jgi:hypothetical protein
MHMQCGVRGEVLQVKPYESCVLFVFIAQAGSPPPADDDSIDENVNEHRRLEKTGYEYWYDLRLFDS